MAVALVGTIGTATQGASGASVSPGWGASENRTAGNLLICFVSVAGVATLPSTPSGWSIAKQVAGTSCSATIYYKTADGSDAAPTISGITNGIIAAQLAEYSGAIADVVDQSGSATGTSSPVTATNAGADSASSALILMCSADRRSTARSPNDTWTSNHVTSVTQAGNNNGTSSQNHYSFGYGTTNSNSGADTAVLTASVTTSITGIAVVDAVFKAGTTNIKTGPTADAILRKRQPRAALVQSVTNAGAASPVTASITPTAGNALVAFVANGSGSTNAITVSDDQGNTWTRLAQGFQTGATFSRVEIWIAFNVAGAATVVSATTGGANIQIAVEEWSSLYDLDIASSGGNASATSAPTGSLATTDANDILFAAINYNTNSSARTSTHDNVGSYWVEGTAPAATSSTGLRRAYRPVPETGSYSDSWTLSTATTSGWVIVAVRMGGYKLTADAVLKATISSSFTANAVLKTTQSASFTANAIIRKTPTATLTADAILKATISASLTADAVLRATQSASFTADAVLLRTQTASLTADAVLKKTISPSLAADAVLLKTQSASVTADAQLVRTTSSGFTADAVTRATISASLTADAVLFRTQVASLTADAVLFRTQTASITADALVRRTASATFTADAALRASFTGGITADAVVRKTVAASFTADAVTRQTRMDGFVADSVFLSPRTFSLTADALLVLTTVGGLTADATVQRTQSASFTADAFIVGAGAVTGSVTADAVFRVTAEKALTADAVLRATQAASFVTEALLRATGTGSYSADAVLRTTRAISFSADAALRATRLETLTSDAVVRSTRVGSFTANAYIRPPFVVRPVRSAISASHVASTLTRAETPPAPRSTLSAARVQSTIRGV